MGDAMLAGRRFRIDPTSVSWNFDVKTNKVETVGGRVIQVFGTKITDMTLTGSFGVGGVQQQLAFLKEMYALAHEQAEDGMKSNAGRHTHRFIYPPRDWNFLVYLKAYSSPDGHKAVVHDPTIFNPKWTLTLFIVQDNAGLRTVAENAYISRLVRGMGWRQSEFNGGTMNMTGQPLQDALSLGAGLPTGGTSSGSNFPQAVERWRPLVARYFDPEHVNNALRIIKCESEGNQYARNTITTGAGNAEGLFQHMPLYWPARAKAAGFEGYPITHAEANVAASALLFKQSNYLWARHWECAGIVGIP